ncbi:hypothetical protein HOO54_14415 [Bacillus sp. WMMC1349]|uniref:hypothetical protein n=1 Tax=Bacillus sp. WMMC1349 TaxID=2736254 RepID=UPI001555DB3D|nr:hypothetical protein [Bacillus sp. WMMC1349]NPC93398.1 hypothetical protein [Bacillus sp. WMMC1349]
MVKKSLLLTLVIFLNLTVLTPFSDALASEKDYKQQEQLSDVDLDKKVVEKEIDKLRNAGINEFSIVTGFEDKDESVLFPDNANTQAKWKTILTGSKTLTRADFYAHGAYIFMITSILGWGRTLTSILAGVLGVAVTAVPNALPGEKLRFKKEMKWVNKKKYIYDIRTTEYIRRNGKTAIISRKVIREDGWGNG